MSWPSDPELRVLHGLRLKSFASVERIAELSGVGEAEVASILEAARAKEWARYREGALTGWMLVPAGREQTDARLQAEVAASGARPDVEAAYAVFLSLNQPMLQVCTNWQVRPVPGDDNALNDHSDAAYDADVTAALAGIDSDVQPICASLAAIFDRFAGYGPRFRHAATRVQDGEVEYFTKPMIDSYHTVWFELHEDLLRTLGIERSSEST